MTTPQPFSDRTTALDFIVSCQQDPATGTAFLGEDRAGVEAELEGLGQPWLQTVRAVVERGRLLAAVAVEWDEEPSMAWVHGPWGTPDAVRTHGPGLVMAAVDQVPPAIRRFELCGHVANTAMAVVADRLGLAPTETSLALVVAADEAAGWIPPEPLQAVTVRPAVPADRAALARLHAPEFGEAYATVDQLLTHHRTVVAEAPDGRLLGYASGGSRTTARPTWTSPPSTRRRAAAAWAGTWSRPWSGCCSPRAPRNWSTSRCASPAPPRSSCTCPWGCARTRPCADTAVPGRLGTPHRPAARCPDPAPRPWPATR